MKYIGDRKIKMVINIEEKAFKELTKYDEGFFPSGNRLYDSILTSVYNGIPLKEYQEKMIDSSCEQEETEKFDMVSKPSHYTEGREFEPKDVIVDWDLNFFLGNALKYISRAGRKYDAIEDLRKAKQYIDFEIERLIKEGEKTNV